MKKNLILIVVLLIVAGAAFKYVRLDGSVEQANALESAQSVGYQAISPQRAWELIQKRSDLLLIDVRGQDELSEGRIAGAVNIPFLDFARGRANVPKGKPVLLICAVGGRSLVVGRYLASIGYPEVYNLEGGISAWKQAGLPLK